MSIYILSIYIYTDVIYLFVGAYGNRGKDSGSPVVSPRSLATRPKMGGKRRRRKVALSTGGGRPSAAGNAQKSQGSTQKKRKRCSTLSDSAIVGSFILPALGVILPEVRRMKRTRAAECRRGCYDMADDVENLLKETNIEMKFNISTVMDEISTFEMCLLDLFASDRTTLLCLCS